LIPDLRPGENVIRFQHQHFTWLLRKLLWPVLLLGAWAVSAPYVVPFISGLGQDPTSPPPEGVMAIGPTCLWAAWAGIGVGCVLWAIYLVFDWRGDWVALTDRRLIVMDKALIFHEARSEAPVERVQNVIADYPNGLAMALDYGHLRVDTAGEGSIAFDNLPHPKAMREAIFAQQEAAEALGGTTSDGRKAAITDMLKGKTGTLSSGAVLQPSKHVWRKHWFFLLRGIAAPVLLWLLSVALWFATIYGIEQGAPGTPSSIVGWAVVVLAPVCLIWAVYNWENWRNDRYVLDGEHLYDIESLPFGMREQSKQTLVSRVTDVSYELPGPMAHLLDYGDVVLKTPGEATQFTFDRVPHPRQVQTLIMRCVEEQHLREQAVNDEEIGEWLKAYHEAQQEGKI
jgi:hypothetical protein